MLVWLKHLSPDSQGWVSWVCSRFSHDFDTPAMCTFVTEVPREADRTATEVSVDHVDARAARMAGASSAVIDVPLATGATEP